jgi:hypothetical protein
MPDIAFAPLPYDAVTLAEDVGLTGSWHWNFGSDALRWSPGFYRLLGLDPAVTRASYDLFIDLVHPADQSSLGTAAQVRRGEARNWKAFRIIRPDGMIRTLSARTDLACTPDGLPTGATVSFVNVANQEQLRHVFETERRQRSALYAQRQAYFFSVRPDLTFDYQPEIGCTVGLTVEEFNADPFVRLLPGERERLLEKAEERRIDGLIFQDRALYRRLDGALASVRIMVVPIHDASGALIEGRGLQYADATQVHHAPASLRVGLEQAVRGNHLRGARGLLDWSMSDLAARSDLSLSTIRRLEEDAPIQANHSRHRAIAALRRAGVRFFVLDGGISILRC